MAIRSRAEQRLVFGMILVIPRKSAKGGQWRTDAFDVLDRKRVIGRIMRTHIASQPWFWAITARIYQRATDRGYAASQKDAVVQLRRR
jgi:hypothetical protein